MRDKSAEAILEFLVDLEIALHSVSIPADVTARLVTRVADRLDVTFDSAIFQNYIAADLRSGAEARARIKHTPYEPSWNLSRTQELTDLARGLDAGSIPLDQGRELLDRIMARPALYSKAYVMAGYCAYGALVAARIGGSAFDAAATLIVGCVGALIYVNTSSHRSLQLQSCFVAGLFGAPLALLLAFVLPIHTGKVLFGAVALLLPATAMTIAIHELANDALESGVMRLAYALLRFLMLGVGIGAAVSLWKLVAPMPPLTPTEPLPIAIILPLLVPGALALALCLQVRLRDWGWLFAAVLVAYGSQELTKLAVGEDGSPFMSAFAVGVGALLYQRASGGMPIFFVVPGLFQLVPGFLGTRIVLQTLRGQGAVSASFADVLLVALELVTGLLVAALFARRPTAVVASR